MDINRNNYEAWLLDLMEGRLSSGEAQEVRDFISLNPDCAVGMENFEPLILEAENLSFSGKTALRKELPDFNSPVSEMDFDLFSIASMEGDLSEVQQKDYQQILDGDEEKMKEWLHWKQMKLKGKVILFPGKNSLKKRVLPPSRLIWIGVASSAAALIFFFTLFIPDQTINSTTPVALETAKSIVSSAEQEGLEAAGEDIITEAPKEEPVIKEEPSNTSARMAGETSILTIRKYQNPPELSGEKRDTSSQELKEAELQERPIRMAVLESNLMRPPLEGSYDKIEKLDFAREPVNTEKWRVDEYAEEGLKESYRTFLEEKNISLLSIASSSVDGINRVSGSDLKLNVARDEKGEVRGFRFRSALISIDAPVKKRINSQ